MVIDNTIGEGKKGVVTTHSYVFARVPFRSTLSDEDGASCDELSHGCFDAEALRARITAVTSGALSFLMCHC